MKRVQIPMTDEDVKALHAGDAVLISGIVYTARDAAHKRMADTIAKGEALPIDIDGNAIYYLGPTPPKPGQVIGSAGPTTSGRMDKQTPMLLERGLKAMIGKGRRSEEVISAMKKNCAVYFAATGGVAALLAKAVTGSETVAYDDLGTEAIRKLTLKEFPAIVAIDCYGENQYKKGPSEFLKQKNK